MDLSTRGIYALESIGIFEEIKKHAVPMVHKIFHDRSGGLTHIPLGPTAEHHVLAVSRHHLFQALLEQTKKFPNITIYFRCKLVDVEFSSLTIYLYDLNHHQNFHVKPDVLIGADGCNSSVRKAFECHTKSYFTITPMPQSYKELNIPAETGQKLAYNAMHFWSRDQMMLVAQPNHDHSFTCALLMPEEGESNSFQVIRTAQQVELFFESYFPDARPLISQLGEQYEKNVANHLRILQGVTWTCNGNVLLIGDAAHGTVPFFGQGVNCCFEDCTILEQSLTETNNHWQTALLLFDARRVKNGNAMSSLSFSNYPELLYRNVFDRNLLKKQIEGQISKKYGADYVTYHNLVCFSRVPYVYAMACKNLQEPLLDRLSDGIEHVDQLDWKKVNDEIIYYKQQLNIHMNSEREIGINAI